LPPSSAFERWYDNEGAIGMPRAIHCICHREGRQPRGLELIDVSYLAMGLDCSVMSKGFWRPLAYPQLGLI
jgi:hypothetical protein